MRLTPVPRADAPRLRNPGAKELPLIAREGQRSDVDRLVREQAALGRVAALASEGVTDADLFAGVAEEVAKLFDATSVTIDRCDGTSTSALAGWPESGFPVGTGWPLEGDSLLARVRATEKPARIDDDSDLPEPVAAAVRQTAIRSAVGVPIIVEGDLWGLLCVGTPVPTPPGTEVRLAAFTQMLATAIVRGEARERLRILVEEHAALRRVAILVAQGVPPSVLFNAVAEEVARLFGVAAVTLNRYEGDECVVLADPQDSDFPVGSRWPLDGESLATRVFATGKPARIDDYTGLPGAIAEQMRRSPSASAVGVPIVVEGKVWGVLTVGRRGPTRMPPDTVQRVIGFTELVAASLANAEAQEHLRDLVGEQAALRHVASLVAEGVGNDELFAVVAEEVGRVVGVPGVTIDRYESDGTASVVLACWQANEDPWWPVGSRWPLDGPSVAKQVWETGQPAFMDDYTEHSGSIATHYHGRPKACGIGVPIFVDGKVWGLIGVGSTLGEPVPADTEERLVGFTELIATAIANRAAWDRVGRLADEQAVLRRIATLVAEGAPTAALLDTVARDVGRLLGVPTATVGRYGAGPSFTVVAASNDVGLPVGSQWPLDGPSMAKAVLDGRRAARVDDYSSLEGTLAEAVRSTGILSAVGSPIAVDGSVWGVISVSATDRWSLPPDTEDRLEQFTELVATAIANSQARDNVRALIDEQTALRRLAILVAVDAPAAALFSTVAVEAGHVLGVPGVSVDRFDAGGATSTVVATWGVEPFPVGSQWPIEEGTVAWTVFHTGDPARVDNYGEVAGTVADALHGLYADASIVGVPIVVEGRVWGMIGVGIPWPGVLAADTEARLGRFTDLVATAISNSEAREVKRALADEQAALRRVATLVAQGATAAELCGAVAEEVWHLLDVPAVTLDRYDQDGSTTVLGDYTSHGESPFPVGSRWPVDPGTASWFVYHTGRPARLDAASYASAQGSIADALRAFPSVSVVGVPIEVDGRVWGMMGVASPNGDPLPPGIEDRVSGFTELVATAISNAEAHDRLRGVGEEQAALRRVATLVARGARGSELFPVVAEQIGRVLDVPVVTIDRYDPDCATTVLAAWSSSGDPDFEIGSRWPLDDGPSVAAAVLQSGRPARLDDYSGLSGTIAERLDHLAHASSVGVPIVVDDAVWGVICVGLQEKGVLPADTETRLSRFTDLVATAISNAEARDRVSRLADEQSALRQVAVLVARGTDSTAVFDAVCEVTCRLVGAAFVNLVQFTSDGFSLTIAGWSRYGEALPVGTRYPLAPGTLGGKITHTGAPARMERDEVSVEELASFLRQHGVGTRIGAPVVVEGKLWGALIAGTTDGGESLVPGTEGRLARFTELIATAISNAASRRELIASRARIVAAGDEERRRVERNLHDGIQQRLIALGLEIQVVRSTVSPEFEEAHVGFERVGGEVESILEDVRELSRGLHPTLLTRAGLGPSLRALARRSSIPVELSVRLSDRLPDPIEIGAYYVVSEALTNAIKHSQAKGISITVSADDSGLTAVIEDDGVGGATAGEGSGILGLADRVEALGGRLALSSPQRGGTRVAVEFPLAPGVDVAAGEW
jgi:GAF domain-containing protein